MWGLEATNILRHVTIQHIKGITNVLVDFVSRLRAGGLYHDIDFQNHQQEFSTPFEPLPSVDPVTHMLLKVNELAPKIEELVQNYNALNDLSTKQNDKAKLSLENVLPKDILQLEQKVMSLPELTPHRVKKKTTKNIHFAKT